jgi:hypothetical protein
MFLRNAGVCLHVHTMLQPRSLTSILCTYFVAIWSYLFPFVAETSLLKYSEQYYVTQNNITRHET